MASSVRYDYIKPTPNTCSCAHFQTELYTMPMCFIDLNYVSDSHLSCTLNVTVGIWRHETGVYRARNKSAFLTSPDDIVHTAADPSQHFAQTLTLSKLCSSMSLAQPLKSANIIVLLDAYEDRYLGFCSVVNRGSYTKSFAWYRPY